MKILIFGAGGALNCARSKTGLPFSPILINGEIHEGNGYQQDRVIG